jgi:hypothetical protein
MTLILTALCKNGICICADKRSITWTNGVLDKIEDNLNKLYKFNEIPLIIFNHGVNKFNNKSWETLCTGYEKSDRWKNKSLKEIVDDFKDFVNEDIVRQLNININNMPNVVGVRQTNFVLCGKDLSSGKYGFYELRWSPEYSSNSWQDTRLIVSGEGYEKYLKQHLLNNSQLNTAEVWGTRTVQQAISELKKLFSIALDNRKKVGGNEFSDNFDTEYLFD